MRALKAIVIAMAVLITGATAALIVLIVLKVTGPAPHAVPRATAPETARAPGGITPGTQTVLDEPAGSRILAMVPVAHGLALALGGGGEEDRVVIIDPASGRVLGRVRLTREPAQAGRAP